MDLFNLIVLFQHNNAQTLCAVKLFSLHIVLAIPETVIVWNFCSVYWKFTHKVQNSTCVVYSAFVRLW